MKKSIKDNTPNTPPARIHGLALEMKTIERETRTIDVVISTNDRDRQGDIVEPKGLDFVNFMKNPVVQWGHDLNMPPVGKVLNIHVFKNRVEAKVQFAETEFAKEVFELYAGGYMNAWSIGFLPKRWERIEASNDDPGGFHILEAEMIELSAVPVPANPVALSKALINIKSPELRKAFDLKKRKTYILTEKGEIGTEGTGINAGWLDWANRKDGIYQTPDGLVLLDSAFSKSLTEAITAGKVLTSVETIKDASHAGTEIIFEPIRINKDNEITEAKVLDVVVKVFEPDQAPEDSAPSPATKNGDTLEDSRREEGEEDAASNGDQEPQEDEVDLHSVDASLAETSARLALLDADFSDLV